jgi:hypothetical protein
MLVKCSNLPVPLSFAHLVIARWRSTDVANSEMNHWLLASLEDFMEYFCGSARESVEMYDWRGFGALPQFDSRSRRRCGNVETRVLCGFPSSEGGRTVVAECSIIPALGASFPQRGPVYRPSVENLLFGAADGAK